MSRTYLMMPYLPAENALLQKVAAAFAEKAIFTGAELIFFWERPDDLKTYLGHLLYGMPSGGLHVRNVVRGQMDPEALVAETDAYIVGRHPEELPLLDLAFQRGLPIYGPEDDWFEALELSPDERTIQAKYEQMMETIFVKYAPRRYEIILFHQGLGECSVFFSWLHAYKEMIGKEILLLCFQESRVDLMKKCPDADVVGCVPMPLYSYLAARQQGWKNFYAMHFLPGMSESKQWTFMEEIRAFLGLPEDTPFQITRPLPFDVEARTAELKARALGLERGSSVMLFVEGLCYHGFYEAHPEFWALVVRHLRAQGFGVVLNGNIQIAGAINVFLPFWETVALTSWCGHIVSISTGIAEACCTFATAAHISMMTVWPDARDPYLRHDPFRWKSIRKQMQDYGMHFMEENVKGMHRYEDRVWGPNVDAADVFLPTDAAEQEALAARIAARIAEKRQTWQGR